MNVLLYSPCKITECIEGELYHTKSGREGRECHGFCFQTPLFYDLISLLAEKSQAWFFLASL